MTFTVNGMKSKKLVSMDIDHLRGWAEFMDRAMIISLIAVIISAAALGVTTWLSIKFSGAVRAHESAAFDRYKAEMGRHAAQLEEETAAARERTAQLEQSAADANERAARESATANERTVALENDAALARKRVVDLEKAVEGASARAAEPGREAAAETARRADGQGAPERTAANRDEQPSQIVASLRKYAGTKAAVYVLEEAPDAAAVGSTIAGFLTDAGWAPLTWTWSGVSGILGVVVLIKEGSDPATDEAASGVLDTLRSAGFNAAKGNWPADWRRFRGTLNGPQTPGPTEAPIRIVIGAKAH
jgi:hypothetical protein